jgi:hypothetical protein
MPVLDAFLTFFASTGRTVNNSQSHHKAARSARIEGVSSVDGAIIDVFALKMARNPTARTALE